MKPMRIPTPEESAEYDRISKEDAKKKNAARAVASQAYSETMKQIDILLREGKIDQPEHIRLMVRALKKCEAAENKASQASHLVMVAAWNRYILGIDEEEKVGQMALWQ